MVLYVIRVLKNSERQENFSLRGGSVEICSRGGLLGVPQVPQCPTLIRNGKVYEYISMDNI